MLFMPLSFCAISLLLFLSLDSKMNFVRLSSLEIGPLFIFSRINWFNFNVHALVSSQSIAFGFSLGTFLFYRFG